MKGASFFSGIGPHRLPYPADLCHYQPALPDGRRLMLSVDGATLPGQSPTDSKCAIP